MCKVISSSEHIEVSIMHIFYLFQIKVLQNELQKNHFKITEERKIVSEIDKLNRSKRAVKEINSVKVCIIKKHNIKYLEFDG